MITKNKVAIWSRLNVSISDCIITERSKRLGLSINAAVGVSATLAQLKERCDATFAAYVANPSSDKAWRAALEAATALEQALDRAAPAGANRSRRSADAEYDDDADNNPFAASRNNLSRHVGEEIQRVAGPMLEAAGGAGLGTGDAASPVDDRVGDLLTNEHLARRLPGDEEAECNTPIAGAGTTH